MIVKIKTKAQLLKDGWVIDNGTYRKDYCTSIVDDMEEYFGTEIELNEGSFCQAGWVWDKDSYE